MSYFKIIKFLAKIIPYPSLEKSITFVKWKNRLLFVLLAGLIFLGVLAYVPAMILSVKEKIWSVMVLDTIVYFMVIFITFSKRFSAETKVVMSIITFYILGVALLILLGEKGAGFNWLFVFPILSSFFYGTRGVKLAFLVSFITLALITIPVYYKISWLGLISQYSLGGWIVNSVNFLVISTLISIALSVIISNINKALKKEIKMTHLLRENQEKLASEKNRAEESDRLKSAFLANMSHEIRTPMNSILGFSELLTDPELSPDKMESYNRLIQHSGEQLLNIIDDIIDISKIESNQMSINSAPTNIYLCVMEVAEIQSNRITALGKNLKLIVDVKKNIKGLITQSDEFRVKQIITNLVDNAVKYSDSGTITIGYTLSNSDKGDVIEFFVKDTGRGIPQEAQEKIFDRFMQADNIDFKKGTGLGLSIIKGLLELLGGTIRLKSEKGKGSEFYFTLPYVETTIKNNLIETESNLLDLTGKVIYVAEDDILSFYYIEELLGLTRAEVKNAPNGKILLDLIEIDVPDLILLDINMPIMNGFETIEKIREKYSDIPVVAQTAYAMQEERQKCFDMGCNDYISKPIDKKQFFKLIATYLFK